MNAILEIVLLLLLLFIVFFIFCMVEANRLIDKEIENMEKKKKD